MASIAFPIIPILKVQIAKELTLRVQVPRKWDRIRLCFLKSKNHLIRILGPQESEQCLCYRLLHTLLVWPLITWHLGPLLGVKPSVSIIGVQYKGILKGWSSGSQVQAKSQGVTPIYNPLCHPLQGVKMIPHAGFMRV